MAGAEHWAGFACCCSRIGLFEYWAYWQRMNQCPDLCLGLHFHCFRLVAGQVKIPGCPGSERGCLESQGKLALALDLVPDSAGSVDFVAVVVVADEG